MIKKIGKKEYDTENAKLIKKITQGYYGDPKGYEEILYQTPDGLYFVYGHGGASSPYPKETIQRLPKDKVNEWLASRK